MAEIPAIMHGATVHLWISDRGPGRQRGPGFSVPELAGPATLIVDWFFMCLWFLHWCSLMFAFSLIFALYFIDFHRFLHCILLISSIFDWCSLSVSLDVDCYSLNLHWSVNSCSLLFLWLLLFYFFPMISMIFINLSSNIHLLFNTLFLHSVLSFAVLSLIPAFMFIEFSLLR